MISASLNHQYVDVRVDLDLINQIGLTHNFDKTNKHSLFENEIENSKNIREKDELLL